MAWNILKMRAANACNFVHLALKL